MIFVVNFAVIKLVLDEVGKLLVVVVAVDGVWWTLSFEERSIELGLKLE